MVVDVRPIERFAAGHIPGSVSIPLRPQFASWLGWLVSRDRPIVFVSTPTRTGLSLVRQCLTVGYERLARGAGGPYRGVAVMRHFPWPPCPWSPPTTCPATMLDVRQANEFASGHVPNAVHVELGDTAERASTLPTGPLTVMCGHGERAMSAASILAANGRSELSVLVGGPDDVVAARRQRLAV